ncbi:MAG: transposase [Candidatus Omnitrophica bacterium]|nr:transposase [Candidatus Omnitrophota bacterium]
MADILDLVKEGKVKRFFRARNKVVFKEAVCHVTQHAAGKEPLFLEEADHLYALHLIKEKSKRFNFEVFGFVLMPNHIHILLRLGSENLSRAMKNLFECYAMYFNKKYERKGHLFCGAYRNAICFDDSYLLAASLYIHLNPVKAKIVKNPADYRWSSCSVYLRPISKKTFLNSQFILQILDRDIAEARKKYKELLEDLKSKKMEDSLENPKALENFRSRLVETFVKRFGKAKKEDRKENFLYDQELESKIEELKKRKRLRSPQDIAARKFIIEQLLARGFDISDIEAKLGISRASIHRTLCYNETK